MMPRMAQVKIYGIRERLVPIRERLSKVIHDCVSDVLKMPRDKRAQRFFPMERENLIYPEGRSDAYTIIEIVLMEGRSVGARKKLVRLLFDRVHAECGITPHDLEVHIYELPRVNCGFRGYHGDEIQLDYPIDV